MGSGRASPDRAQTAELARATAAATLPNRRTFLRDLGYKEAETPDERLVDAIVAHGPAKEIVHRVQGHLDAGADHVSLHLLTATPNTPPARQWEQLAAHLLV
ncbi:hypothetical protein ACFY05_36290 [Microtetraspora fusca]|uniref:LLM class flavin-dependent oxidoreductase n=1 Tax=Microtetraspora fusca TaxID=1997 RepID=A0ABW6VJI4_MICFU